MLERVVEAIERRDYQRADRLLQDLKQQEPDHPWIAFYSARLAEASGNLAVAEQGYREVLCNATNPKIISQARQGIERLVQIERRQRQQERDRAMAEPGNQEPGVLVLEAIDPELEAKRCQKICQNYESRPLYRSLTTANSLLALISHGFSGRTAIFIVLRSAAAENSLFLPSHQPN